MRLLLKTVQHVYGPTEADGIDGAIGVSVVILHNLQHSGTRSLPRLRRGGFPAKLSEAQSSANTVFDRFGKRQQVPFRRTHPIQRLFAASRSAHQVLIPVLGYHQQGGGVPGPFIAHGSHWHLTGSGRLLGGERVVATDRPPPCGLVPHKGTSRSIGAAIRRTRIPSWCPKASKGAWRPRARFRKWCISLWAACARAWAIAARGTSASCSGTRASCGSRARVCARATCT